MAWKTGKPFLLLKYGRIVVSSRSPLEMLLSCRFSTYFCWELLMLESPVQWKQKKLNGFRAFYWRKYGGAMETVLALSILTGSLWCYENWLLGEIIPFTRTKILIQNFFFNIYPPSNRTTIYIKFVAKKLKLCTNSNHILLLHMFQHIKINKCWYMIYSDKYHISKSIAAKRVGLSTELLFIINLRHSINTKRFHTANTTLVCAFQPSFINQHL